MPSKIIKFLQEYYRETVITTKPNTEVHDLLMVALHNIQKVREIGSQGASGIRKKRKMDKFKEGGTYHKDYSIDPSTGSVRGHGLDDAHGKYPHINIKRKDETKVVINIVPG